MKRGLLFTILFFSFSLSSDPLTEKYKIWAKTISDLYQEIIKLEVVLKKNGYKNFQSEWKEVFEKKLIPQINTIPSLIIAITGGTNTGKSSIYNYLLNADMSSVSESAGHTKHTVLSTHPETFDITAIQQLYSSLKVIQDALPMDAATEKGQAHELLVKISELVPKNFILTDSPDIDSRNKNNWKKAYDVARSADVVIAVLSDDKYINDQVIEFYKLLKESGKPLIVIINKVTEEEINEKYPETWLKEFCEATGNLIPLKAYTVIRSIKDVKNRNLRFIELDTITHHLKDNADFRKEVQSLDVDTLRIQALEGALKFALQGNGQDSFGVEGFLSQVENRSNIYKDFYKTLQTETVLKDLRWPTIPPALLFDIIQNWWDKSEHRTGYARKLDTYTNWVELPFRAAMNLFLKNPKKEVLDEFKKHENLAIDDIVNAYFKIFDPLLKSEGTLISESSKELLNPSTVTKIIAKIRRKHATDPKLQQDLELILNEFITGWGKDHPTTITLSKIADSTYNTVKILTAISLPFGNLLQGTLSGLGTYAVGASATSKTIRMGKKMVSESPVGVNWVFEDIVNEYNRLNILWVVEQLQKEFEPILLEIKEGATLTKNENFISSKTCLQSLLSN